MFSRRDKFPCTVDVVQMQAVVGGVIARCADEKTERAAERRAEKT